MKTRVHGRDIIYRDGPRGWALVIMPDYILIDNYYHGPHIHKTKELNETAPRIPIKFTTLDEVYEVVLNHIEKNRGVNYNTLVEELSI